MTASEFPLVSIVTPTYNQAEFLAETIESVLAQDYPNIEYVVINDGSTDHTEEVLRRYGDRLKWTTQCNIGQSETLNKGWRVSAGKYLGYLSSDDLLYPTAISELVKVLENDLNIVCAYPNSNLIDERSVVVKESVCRAFDLEELIVCQECHIGPGAIFRSDAFRKVGGWRADLRLAPDREFWMRLAGHGSFYFEENILAGYRIHPSSISYKDVSEAVTKEYLKVLDDYFSSGRVLVNIERRREEAYGRAKFIVARNLLRSGNACRGVKMYREACESYPILKSPRYKIQLLRNVIGKPLRLAWGKLKGFF